MLSGDPVLAQVAGLFTRQARATELTERSARPTAPSRSRERGRALRRGLRTALSTPELLGVVALVLLVVCALLGGVLDSPAIALGGLAAPLLLGIGCYFAIKRRRPQLSPATQREENRRGNW